MLWLSDRKHSGCNSGTHLWRCPPSRRNHSSVTAFFQLPGDQPGHVQCGGIVFEVILERFWSDLGRVWGAFWRTLGGPGRVLEGSSGSLLGR